MKQYKRESRKQKQKQSVCVCVRISKVLGRKYLDDEDRLLVLQGEVGESVDWRDRLQGHLAAGGPGQVGTEHHGQVAAGHLVQTASILYLTNAYSGYSKHTCLAQGFIFKYYYLPFYLFIA